MQPAESTTTPARSPLAPLAIPAMMIIGFFAGRISGPFVLPDLDIDVYYISPTVWVYCWGFLWAIASDSSVPRFAWYGRLAAACRRHPVSDRSPLC